MSCHASPLNLSRRMLLSQALAVSTLAACTRDETPRNRELAVFAAASLQEALTTIAASFQQQSGTVVRTVFAGSSQLARQIEQGAPADLFFSADIEWMDWLAERNLVQSEARRIVAGNTLVLIEPTSAPSASIELAPGPDLAERLNQRLEGGRLAMAEPEVPAGRYGQQALTALGVWPLLADHLAPTETVRAALALVARGEAPLGIVYGTDAKAEPRVRVLATFPAASHTPIVYPAAPVRRAGTHESGAHDSGAHDSGVRALLDFVMGPTGQAYLRNHGFAPPP